MKSQSRKFLLGSFAIAVSFSLILILTGGAVAKDKDDHDRSSKEAVMYSPESELGIAHLSMYNEFGTVCTDCHDGSFLPAAPSLKGMKKVKMSSKDCVTCHYGDKAPVLFISLMNTMDPAYWRCDDCHPLK